MGRKLRKSAVQLVKEAEGRRPTTSWYEQLSLADQEYVCQVVGEMRKNPDAAYALVARNLIVELSIERSVCSVIRILKELMHNDKK